MKTNSSVSSLPRPLSTYCLGCGTEISTEYKTPDGDCPVCRLPGDWLSREKDRWVEGALVESGEAESAKIVKLLNANVALLGEFAPARAIETSAFNIVDAIVNGWLVAKHEEATNA